MSEQVAGPTSGEQGSLNEGISHSAETSSEPVTASATESGAAAEVPVSEPVMSEPSMSEPALPETPKAEAAKADAGATTPRDEPEKDRISNLPGKVIVMSRGERAWADNGIHSGPEVEQQQNLFGKRRIAAIAAVLALATTAGAVGGALVTAALMHGTSDVAAAASTQPLTLTASLSRIDSDIQALKAGLDHTSKLGSNQFNRTSERLDKLERAQAEPAAKLAKLSEAIDKLHALPVPAPAVAAATPSASAASKDITGSIASTPTQQQAAASVAPKNDMKGEFSRLPTVDGWVLRDVAYGGALIDGRRGVYEVYAGDMVPGLGRIDAVRRQDGHWVVVTSRGLIVAR